MKSLMIVLSILLIFGSSDFHGQTQRQITPADAYRNQQRMYEQQQRAYQQQQQRYREQQQRYQQQMRAYQQQQQQRYQQQVQAYQQQQKYQQQMRAYQQQQRQLYEQRARQQQQIAMGRIPKIANEAWKAYNSPQGKAIRKAWNSPERKKLGAYQGLRNSSDAVERKRQADQKAERARLERESYQRQNERYIDRMATRAGQANQRQRLTERTGLGKVMPDIPKKDVQRMKDYFGIKDLGSSNERTTPQRSTPQRNTPQRSTPQRRDTPDRSRSNNSSRSGGGSSNRPESKDWREANRERLDRVGNK